MLHGLNNNFLYSAKKIIAIITDGTTLRLSRGTGFFIKKDDKLIFVTNRHMIDPGYGDKNLKDYKIQEFQIESYQSFDERGRPIKLNAGIVHNVDEFMIDEKSSNDIACLADVRTDNEGITINAFIDYTMLADKSWFDNKLSVCDTIAYPGFPEWFDRKNNTPIFRMGSIASDPRFDYSLNPSENPDAARIAYEGFSSGGASGSPVFSIQKGFPIGGGLIGPEDFYREVKVIGINAGHYNTVIVNDYGDPIEENEIQSKDGNNITEGILGHSGISYFYKSSVIIDMINRLCS